MATHSPNGARPEYLSALPVFSGSPAFGTGHRWLGMIVGYELARNGDGEVENTGKTYVLPAERVLELVEGLR